MRPGPSLAPAAAALALLAALTGGVRRTASPHGGAHVPPRLDAASQEPSSPAVVVLRPGRVPVQPLPLHPPARSSLPIEARPEPTPRPFPGGGRIAFGGGDGGYGEIEVVDGKGSLEEVLDGWPDVGWTSTGRQLIAIEDDGPSTSVVRLSRSSQDWVATPLWRIAGAGAVRVSPGMRRVAYESDRSQGPLRVCVQDARRSASCLEPGRNANGPRTTVTWLDERRLVIDRLDGLNEWQVWDVVSDALRPFFRPAASALLTKLWLDAEQGVSWSPDRRLFAVAAVVPGLPRRSDVIVGDSDGRILRVVRTAGLVAVPVWSPVRAELAWIGIRSHGGSGSAGRLYRLDAGSHPGRPELLDGWVPGAWWPTWSPSGDWILAAAYGHNWTFVSRDGSQRVSSPALGYFARWAAPGLDVAMPHC